MTVKAVFFDVGETLISEDRLWRAWARYLGVPPDVFLAALDDVIRRGQDHRQVFERFRPGFDIEAARRDRAASGDPDIFDARDLYPDALSCLRTLRARGFAVGIAGNQPAAAETAAPSGPPPGTTCRRCAPTPSAARRETTGGRRAG